MVQLLVKKMFGKFNFVVPGKRICTNVTLSRGDRRCFELRYLTSAPARECVTTGSLYTYTRGVCFECQTTPLPLPTLSHIPYSIQDNRVYAYYTRFIIIIIIFRISKTISR